MTTRRKKTKGGPAKKDAAVPAGRFWFYPVAVLVVPLFCLVVFEFSLRATGYGFPTTFFVKKDCGGQNVYLANPGVTRRYFPGQIVCRTLPEHFPAVKTNRTFRVFIFGESAAQGMALCDFSFARMLKEMLKADYPGINFEVINTGVTAVNSWTILQFAKETAGYRPDLFVIYCGNNEIVGPYGPGTVFSVLNKRTLVKFRIWTTSLRINQFLNNTASAANRLLRKRKLTIFTGMEMFLNKQILPGDPRIPEAIENYRGNIKEMVAAAQGCGAKVVVCTVAANLKDSPPFGSAHRASLSDGELKKLENLHQQGVRLESQGLIAEATQIYREAEKIDNRYAEIGFRLGRCYYRMGDYPKAKEYYSSARDNDTLCFRPNSSVNQALRRDYQNLSPGTGVQLADVEEAFGRASPEGIIGGNLIYDHIHLNIDGHYRAASKILETVAAAGWLPGSTPSRTPTGTLTKAECLARLGYAELDKYNALKNNIELVSRPPFTNQLDHKNYVQTFETEYKKYLKIQANAAEFRDFMNGAILAYAAGLRFNPQNEDITRRSALAYADLGRFQDAINLYRKILEANPDNLDIYERLGDVYKKMGDQEKAVAWFSKSIAFGLFDPVVYLLRGAANASGGRYNEAISDFTQTIKMVPESYCASIYTDRGLAYVRKKRYDKAIADFTQALAISPAYTAAREGRGSAYIQKGKYDAAIADFTQALAILPNHAKTYNSRAITYYLKGEYEKSRQDIRKAQALGYNVNPGLQQSLGMSPVK